MKVKLTDKKNIRKERGISTKHNPSVSSKTANQGITLVALVVTIVVLLILAGITITLVFSEDGIIKRAINAKGANEEGAVKEEIALALLQMRTDKYDEEYSLENIKEWLPEYLDKTQLGELNITSGKIQGEYKEYEFEIDENKNITIVGTTNFSVRYTVETGGKEATISFTTISKDGTTLVSLTPVTEGIETIEENTTFKVGENDTFTTYKGTPVYNGAETGVYLENAILATTSNYTLNSQYTIILEAKNIQPDKERGIMFLVGMGTGKANHGWYTLGISYDAYPSILVGISGSSNFEMVSSNPINLNDDEWHIYAIKYDGTEFAFYIDGVKIGSSSSSDLKTSKLYIGGISNSGTESGAYWGYANGYYRNLAIYDRGLSDAEMQNYSF